ncbi:uncharacterized protein LOC126895304 isoform X9 [Daktulosphaira vitifoliae]|uniref:uncharacterized protein LOC126895304 isoform X6 n=1 Tax=Daktulosphaira vitifoliae TaxID=58002 RepID=UPI0021A99471|nr:uncharacterized protein LOC126895304 isoform X6 [Daktulosphaira vitifoliae]XP_050522998.1 uncharacterized protein LOC126895304 isoform X7 [Daktulosphaira vitifoliae]XP_050522999.1 uncharacterized protein LOC126895304 isoform X8 [Daktulosphaira vitifoliae]XP_050523000.1 uncharacterized protein LOC126895304 isoform X9 [Daktulosphaira vitifoliae]
MLLFKYYKIFALCCIILNVVIPVFCNSKYNSYSGKTNENITLKPVNEDPVIEARHPEKIDDSNIKADRIIIIKPITNKMKFILRSDRDFDEYIEKAKSRFARQVQEEDLNINDSHHTETNIEDGQHNSSE